MAKLLIVYDPNDKVQCLDREQNLRLGLKQATLPLPEGVEGKDIYAIARKLAELLLEQL